tara:strand:+ start:91 stop:513 length:423 start_codon:yes stop_codon:yes gene_type:complete
MIYKILKIIILFFLSLKIALANTEFYQEGVNLYNSKKLTEAKFKFEQDLVQNPKSENSYLYLAKIFYNLKKTDLAQENLNTVILLNPNNEEAIYNLAKIKLDLSDYKKSKELNEKLTKLCKKFCNKSKQLENEIKNLSKK